MWFSQQTKYKFVTIFITSLEFYLYKVQDWYHENANFIRITHPYSHPYKGSGDAVSFFMNVDRSVDGMELSAMTYDSTLVNGQGRSLDNTMPLATYNVTSGQRYRFHVINIGAEYSYEISIDSHMLNVVALDGQDIETVRVDSVILSPSERVDFEIEISDDLDKYWFRADTLKYTEGSSVVNQGEKAIIRVEGALGDPVSTKRECTMDDPCTIIGCPFEGYPTSHFKTCLSLDDLNSEFTDEYLNEEFGTQESDVEEYFLNWGFNTGSSVNGRVFAHPTSPLHGSHDGSIIQCDDTTCEDGCHCTHILDIPNNKTIQMVLTNYHFFTAHHNIHLHGHSFAVMKVGFPSFNETTGLQMDPNDDVICDSTACAHASWNGQRAGLKSEKPVVKDTVVVPAQGYAVIRFRYGECYSKLLYSLKVWPYVKHFSFFLKSSSVSQCIPFLETHYAT